jgi:uncharacterized 2Fe-2S/4Fe-4S cluster protein (DUF4445 family)
MRSSLDTDAVRGEFSEIKGLPLKLREYQYQVQAAVFETGGAWYLIDVFPSSDEGRLYGISMDLGTSTVVLRLLDLSTGRVMDEASFHNPQIEAGTDILARIHFAGEEGGLDRLQALLIDRLNRELARLTQRNHVQLDAVSGMTVAGNTTMTHLFLGLDPRWICREPYIPVVNRLGLIRSSELGLAINPGAPVLVFPNVGSYFGGDLIAGVLASGMCGHSEIAFLVDVGTNAEVVIGNHDWLMACAGAAGPALEGGVASMGMMAGPGVIDQVSVDPETSQFRIRTIENEPPKGICGSGLIDLVAQLFLAGMIDLRGKFVPGKCGERLTEMDGIPHLVVVPADASGTGLDLTLSQPDIDALMRSKAAMYTILTTIANTVNIHLNEIHRFYVAGTFGSYIDPQSAITIGMIPDLPLDRYVSLGNTSLEGASLALLSKGERDEIYRIRDRITYLELNVNQEFMNLFSAAKFIPHTDRSLFPSVRPHP